MFWNNVELPSVKNSYYKKETLTRWWRRGSEIIVERDGILLVYPDFYGDNLEV